MGIYKIGYTVENNLVQEARKKGLVAFGSRGSHSPIDVVIIDEGGTPHFFQLKSTKKDKYYPSEYKKELAEFKKIKVKGKKHFWIKYRGRRRGFPKWLFKWNSEKGE